MVTYLLGGRKTVIDAGRLSAFWAAIPHQIIDFGRATSYFVATIPLQWFLQWRLPERFVQPLLQGRLVTRAEMAERYYQPLQRAAMELGSLLLP